MFRLAGGEVARIFTSLISIPARTTIAKVEDLVQPGIVDADSIATPGIYVHRLCGASGSKCVLSAERLEGRTVHTFREIHC